MAHIRLSHSSTSQKMCMPHSLWQAYIHSQPYSHTHTHTHTHTQSHTRTHPHVHSHVLINGHAATTMANLHTSTINNATSTRNLNSCRERCSPDFSGLLTESTHTAPQLWYNATHCILCTTLHHNCGTMQHTIFYAPHCNTFVVQCNTPYSLYHNAPHGTTRHRQRAL